MKTITFINKFKSKYFGTGLSTKITREFGIKFKQVDENLWMLHAQDENDLRIIYDALCVFAYDYRMTVETVNRKWEIEKADNWYTQEIRIENDRK